MNSSEIDRYCDLFEKQLQRDATTSLERFLAEEQLALYVELVDKLRELERNYQDRQEDTTIAPQPLPQTDVDTPTVIVGTNIPGAMIDRYKLLETLGEGGMGVVYLAEQTEPVARRVALKVIKPGMDTKQVIARFETERQALSIMDHPNIARVLDAGTTEFGRPYFVMELVNGIPITQYCDDNRLSPRDRLDLFIQVCLGIQHAHQKGIIHRDLKPSNVLVAQYDNRPVPKIIDFGLAKAIGQHLSECSYFTQFGQIVGTFAYMSPEQASYNHLDIDTRADIYSLGVLLYELLVGDTPFNRQRLCKATFDEMLRIIRQEDPPFPSVRLHGHDSQSAIAAHRRMEPGQLSRLVRGDLDWITTKALNKNRSQRYATAIEFAQDVRRYLNSEPVSACRPTFSYLSMKFVRRHKGKVTMLLIVLLSIIVSAWIVAIAVRFDRFANDLVAVAILLPLLSVGVGLGGGLLALAIWSVGRLLESTWRRIALRAVAIRAFESAEPMSFASPSVDDLPAGFVDRFTREHIRRRAIAAFLLGVLLCSGIGAMSASFVIPDPSQRLLQVKIILPQVIVAAVSLVLLVALRIRVF